MRIISPRCCDLISWKLPRNSKVCTYKPLKVYKMPMWQNKSGKMNLRFVRLGFSGWNKEILISLSVIWMFSVILQAVFDPPKSLIRGLQIGTKLTPGEKLSKTNTRLRASHLPPESSNRYCLLPMSACKSMGFFALICVQSKTSCSHARVVFSHFLQLRPLLIPFQLINIAAASHVSTSNSAWPQQGWL